MSLTRFSSRREPLDHAFLRDRLRTAKSYKRIAGYFRRSIFELVGEEIAGIGRVEIRVVPKERVFLQCWGELRAGPRTLRPLARL